MQGLKTIHHICVQTNEYKKSLSFYKNILGFVIEKETENFHGRQYNTWLSLGGFYIELQTPKNGQVFNDFDKNTSGITHVCFFVTDINSEYQRIKNLGWNNFSVKKGETIYQVEGGSLFKIIAPEGTIIEIRESGNI